MKRLLFSTFTILAFGCRTSHANLYAFQQWEHKDDPKKTVGIGFDLHAPHFYGHPQFVARGGVDQKDLMESNDVSGTAQKHKDGIIKLLVGYGEQGKLIVEDKYTYLTKKYGPESVPLYRESCLSGLEQLCASQMPPIACDNNEFRENGEQRDKGCYAAVEKEVASYDDGPELHAYYENLKKKAKKDKRSQATHYLFNARLIHRVKHCTVPRQVVIVGGSHGTVLAKALPLLGYRLRTTMMHPVLQRIVDAPNGDLERVVQQRVVRRLFFGRLRGEKHPGDGKWTAAFLATHPIDMHALVEREREKEERREKDVTKITS